MPIRFFAFAFAPSARPLRRKTLPRLSALLLTLAVLPTAVGCARDRGSSDYLGYTRQEGSFRATLDWQGESYSATVGTGESLTVCFDEPATLADYLFVWREGRETVRSGDLVLPLPEGSAAGRIFRFFTLSEGDFIDVRRQKISGEQINVISFADGVTVYQTAENRPLRFTDGDCTLTIR